MENLSSKMLRTSLWWVSRSDETSNRALEIAIGMDYGCRAVVAGVCDDDGLTVSNGPYSALVVLPTLSKPCQVDTV